MKENQISGSAPDSQKQIVKDEEAAENDVVEQTGREYSGTAGHDPIISKNRDHLSRLY